MTKVRKNVHRKLDSGNPSVTNRASMVAGFSVGCKDWMPSKMPQMYRLAAMHITSAIPSFPIIFFCCSVMKFHPLSLCLRFSVSVGWPEIRFC